MCGAGERGVGIASPALDVCPRGTCVHGGLRLGVFGQELLVDCPLRVGLELLGHVLAAHVGCDELLERPQPLADAIVGGAAEVLVLVPLPALDALMAGVVGGVVDARGQVEGSIVPGELDLGEAPVRPGVAGLEERHPRPLGRVDLLELRVEKDAEVGPPVVQAPVDLFRVPPGHQGVQALVPLGSPGVADEVVREQVRVGGVDLGLPDVEAQLGGLPRRQLHRSP